MKASALALNNCSSAESSSGAFLPFSVTVSRPHFFCSSLRVRLFNLDIGVGGIH